MELQSAPTLSSGTTEAIVLIKAAPVIGIKNGETVCCAGVDLYGNWLRLYPVSFRVLEDGKRFKRWDKVRFDWRLPRNDSRGESRHVNSQTLSIHGHVKTSERRPLLDRHIVTSLDAELEAGRSLALLQPEILDFKIVPKPPEKLAMQQAKIDALHNQEDMFIPKPIVPAKACPYEFRYVYRTDDGDRKGTCQDWETEATYFKWSNEYGEQSALERMAIQFGEVLPKRGLYFAMGTHSMYPETWLINGLIQLKPSEQASLF
ncbi:hypothetical protein FHS72_002005 [Loktanella ponticola]|uniref:Uncharacterized protein n=1 Tax=Yoonia ponticola TaxID=1524255 RepID=A0A7W9EY68_9RHOB|nr:hypothetical protein [Yoonia ponticola]MBB5722379.1 hypothetical protein [Yoonia ponticola]